MHHYLWKRLQEAALIANDVAERQVRVLEKQALDVMTTPGYDDVTIYVVGVLRKLQHISECTVQKLKGHVLCRVAPTANVN